MAKFTKLGEHNSTSTSIIGSPCTVHVDHFRGQLGRGHNLFEIKSLLVGVHKRSKKSSSLSESLMQRVGKNAVLLDRDIQFSGPCRRWTIETGMKWS